MATCCPEHHSSLTVRYKHQEFGGAKTWLDSVPGKEYQFSELHLYGGAQLATASSLGAKSAAALHVDRLYGDKTGYLHVGYNQSFQVSRTDPDIPFNLRVYEEGIMRIPRRAFLQRVNFQSSGKVRHEPDG